MAGGTIAVLHGPDPGRTMLLPFRIECVLTELPWANWLFIGLCSLISLGALYEVLPDEVILAMIAQGWHPSGLVGHMFLHGGWMHLLGNMLFLWVFGNAVCGTVRNWVYLWVFPSCGVLAVALHMLLDGTPVIGASGAINGVVGFVFVLYPINRVHLFYWIIVRAGTFTLPAWVITLVWFAFDLWGASGGEEGVAYWAHVGGFVSGASVAMIMLACHRIVLTEWDNPTLLDWFSGRRAPR